MIYRIFLELFKSKSPLRECSQDHETEHRSVFPIGVKAPYSNPPIREWLISCPRLPLGNLGRYRDILSYPPLQLISSICFLLFHKTERTPFIPNPIRPPLLFPLLPLRIREPCSLSPLFLSRGGNPAHLSSKTRVKSQLQSYFIAPPLILFWRKLCTIFSYKRAFSCDLLISFPPFSTTKFRSWYESENHPALNPLPFYADCRQPSDRAITLCRNLISFLRSLGSKFGINRSSLMYYLHSKDYRYSCLFDYLIFRHFCH